MKGTVGLDLSYSVMLHTGAAKEHTAPSSMHESKVKQREDLLKMESACSFEMLVNFCQNTRRHKPQGSGLHRQRLANPKAHRLKGL